MVTKAGIEGASYPPNLTHANIETVTPHKAEDVSLKGNEKAKLSQKKDTDSYKKEAKKETALDKSITRNGFQIAKAGEYNKYKEVWVETEFEADPKLLEVIRQTPGLDVEEGPGKRLKIIIRQDAEINLKKFPSEGWLGRVLPGDSPLDQLVEVLEEAEAISVKKDKLVFKRTPIRGSNHQVHSDLVMFGGKPTVYETGVVGAFDGKNFRAVDNAGADRLLRALLGTEGTLDLDTFGPPENRAKWRESVAIRELEELLLRAGYPTFRIETTTDGKQKAVAERPDGYFNESSQKALHKFMADNGFPPSSELTYDVLSKLVEKAGPQPVDPNWLQGALEGTGALVQNGLEGGQKLVQQGVRGVQGIPGAVADGTQQLVEGAQQFVDDVRSGEVARNVQENVGRAVEGAEEFVTEKVPELVSNVFNDAGLLAKKLKEEPAETLKEWGKLWLEDRKKEYTHLYALGAGIADPWFATAAILNAGDRSNEFKEIPQKRDFGDNWAAGLLYGLSYGAMSGILNFGTSVLGPEGSSMSFNEKYAYRHANEFVKQANQEMVAKHGRPLSREEKNELHNLVYQATGAGLTAPTLSLLGPWGGVAAAGLESLKGLNMKKATGEDIDRKRFLMTITTQMLLARLADKAGDVALDKVTRQVSALLKEAKDAGLDPVPPRSVASVTDENPLQDGIYFVAGKDGRERVVHVKGNVAYADFGGERKDNALPFNAELYRLNDLPDDYQPDLATGTDGVAITNAVSNQKIEASQIDSNDSTVANIASETGDPTPPVETATAPPPSDPNAALPPSDSNPGDGALVIEPKPTVEPDPQNIEVNEGRPVTRLGETGISIQEIFQTKTPVRVPRSSGNVDETGWIIKGFEDGMVHVVQPNARKKFTPEQLLRSNPQLIPENTELTLPNGKKGLVKGVTGDYKHVTLWVDGRYENVEVKSLIENNRKELGLAAPTPRARGAVAADAHQVFTNNQEVILSIKGERKKGSIEGLEGDQAKVSYQVVHSDGKDGRVFMAEKFTTTVPLAKLAESNPKLFKNKKFVLLDGGRPDDGWEMLGVAKDGQWVFRNGDRTKTIPPAEAFNEQNRVRFLGGKNKATPKEVPPPPRVEMPRSMAREIFKKDTPIFVSEGKDKPLVHGFIKNIEGDRARILKNEVLHVDNNGRVLAELVDDEVSLENLAIHNPQLLEGKSFFLNERGTYNDGWKFAGRTDDGRWRFKKDGHNDKHMRPEKVFENDQNRARFLTADKEVSAPKPADIVPAPQASFDSLFPKRVAVHAPHNRNKGWWIAGNQDGEIILRRTSGGERREIRVDPEELLLRNPQLLRDGLEISLPDGRKGVLRPPHTSERIGVEVDGSLQAFSFQEVLDANRKQFGLPNKPVRPPSDPRRNLDNPVEVARDRSPSSIILPPPDFDMKAIFADGRRVDLPGDKKGIIDAIEGDDVIVAEINMFGGADMILGTSKKRRISQAELLASNPSLLPEGTPVKVMHRAEAEGDLEAGWKVPEQWLTDPKFKDGRLALTKPEQKTVALDDYAVSLFEGQELTVRRSSGKLDPGWRVVGQLEPGKLLMNKGVARKSVRVEDLIAYNPDAVRKGASVGVDGEPWQFGHFTNDGNMIVTRPKQDEVSLSRILEDNFYDIFPKDAKVRVARSGRAELESGWSILGHNDDEIVIGKGELRKTIRPKHYETFLQQNPQLLEGQNLKIRQPGRVQDSLEEGWQVLRVEPDGKVVVNRGDLEKTVTLEELAQVNKPDTSPGTVLRSGDRPILRAQAFRQVEKFLTGHRIDFDERIFDGYLDGGRRMSIDEGGRVYSNREVMRIDFKRDVALQRHMRFAATLRHLPERERAVALGKYIDEMMTPPGVDGNVARHQDLWGRNYQNKEVLIGDVDVREGKLGAGVCRHRSLLFKILGDQAGLEVALVRGNMRYGPDLSYLGGHAWNEVRFSNGETYIVDVMNPSPNWKLPSVKDKKVKETYITVDDQPMYY